MERNEEIEERIQIEIVVDAYDEDEQMMGWFYYLADTISYPFQAEVIAARKRSPLKPGQQVEVVDMGEMDDCNLDEMWVDIRWEDDTLSVPLSQLTPINADEDTEQAVGDWHYWVMRYV